MPYGPSAQWRDASLSEKTRSIYARWQQALQTAVWALQDQLSAKERARIEIEPVIVVAGGPPSLLDGEPEISASIDRNMSASSAPHRLADLLEIVGDAHALSKSKTARELFDPPLEWSEVSESLIAPIGFARP